MLISHRHRFVFIKTIKTAGTSVEGLLEPFCCPPGHVVQHWTPTLVSEHGVVGRRWPQNDRPDYGYYNHMPAGAIQKRLPEFEHYTRITCVRDPYDRAISHFHFLHEALPPRGQMPLEEAIALHGAGEAEALRARFLSFIEQCSYNESGILCIDGTLAVNRWLRYEALVPDLEQLVADLNLPLAGSVAAALPRFKQNRFGRSDLPPLEAYLSPEAVALINARSPLSFSTFGYRRRDPASFRLPARLP
jgi:hypothetical protein